MSHDHIFTLKKITVEGQEQICEDNSQTATKSIWKITGVTWNGSETGCWTYFF